MNERLPLGARKFLLVSLMLFFAGIPFWFSPLRYWFETFPWLNVATRITYTRAYWIVVGLWLLWLSVSIVVLKDIYSYIIKILPIIEKHMEKLVERLKRSSTRYLIYTVAFLLISISYIIFTKKTEGFLGVIVGLLLLWLYFAFIYLFLKFIAQMFLRGTILNLLIFLGVCSIIYFSIVELKNDTFGVRILEVPEKFIKENPGLHSEVFARHISNEVLKINQKALELEEEMLRKVSPLGTGVNPISPAALTRLPKPKIQTRSKTFTF